MLNTVLEITCAVHPRLGSDLLEGARGIFGVIREGLALLADLGEPAGFPLEVERLLRVHRIILMI